MNRLQQLVAACGLGLAIIGSAFAGPVNINTADAETLARELTGVGAVKAEAIIEYRTANGPFKTVDQLVEVKGIGVRTVDSNRDNILLTDEEPAPQAD